MTTWEWIKSLFKAAPAQAAKKVPLENITPIKPNLAPWMTTAKGEIGVKEIVGSKHNPKVLRYHDETTLSANDDETPWCSSFVNWVMKQNGIKGTRSAAAASWLNWGITLKQPTYGCVVVKSRKGGNHVTFFVRLEKKNGVAGLIGLGGNQGNKVCEAWYPLSEVRGYRWPA